MADDYVSWRGNLTAIEARLRARLAKVVNRTAHDAQGQMRERVRKRTGNLARSIQVIPPEEGPLEKVVGVRKDVGREIPDPKQADGGAPASTYAEVEERRHPYAAPAGAKAAKILVRRMVAAVKRVVRESRIE